MPPRSKPRAPTAAEALFASWIADRTRDFEAVVRAAPEHARELRALHALWSRLEPLLALAGISDTEAARRLHAAAEDGAAPPTPLDLLPPTGAGAGSATDDLLRRLESKSRGARYRLEGEVARGGMGAILRVWDEDLRRHLAMKVVLGQATPGTGTPPVDARLLARFLEEAQITGQLEHPGIVPVHELGLDADGRVYFTMKLVKGRDLAAVFELVREGREGWSETRALGVLLKVCEALAYAHSKGVVHRDLKPQNVMVGDFGEVYVMDWGLARVIGDARASPARPAGDAPHVRTERFQERESSPASSLMTLEGDVVGTPAYMSPEQARGELEALSPRSDVYALGAMLYDLLAGAPPYTTRGEHTGGAAVWKRVLDGPPPPLEELAPRAPSELVAIQAKAMAREASQRYADVAALAEDLRAFLEGRVVGAFEAGALAEARKWVRRNRGLAAALAGAVLALIAGLVVTLILADRVRQNAVLAEASATEARRQARVAGEVNAFLNVDVLAAVAPEREGLDVTVREVLDRASASLDGRFAEDPAVEAALRMTIGTSYEKLGVTEPARRHFERALELQRANSGAESEPALLAAAAMASTWAKLGRVTEAIGIHREVVAGFERLHGPEHPATLAARVDLAVELSNDGQYEEAQALCDSTLSILERVMDSRDMLVLTARNNRALLAGRQGRYAEAAAELEDVLELQTLTLGERHPETLTTLGNVASLMFQLGRIGECEELARRGHALCVEVIGPAHPRTGALAGFVGHALLQRGRGQEAEPWLLEYYETTRASVGEDTELAQQARTLVAGSMAALGRLAEAAELQSQTLAVQRRILAPDHPTTLLTANSLATWLLDLGRLDEAEPLFRDTIEAQSRKLGPDHPSTIVTTENLANLLRTRGRLEECQTLLRTVLEARRRALGDEHPDVAKTTYNLGLVLSEAKQPAEALPLLEDAARRCRALGGDAPPGVLSATLRTLGDLRLAAREHDAALQAYRESLAEHRRSVADDARSGFLLHQIGSCLLAKQDFESALAAFEEAYPLRLLGTDADGTSPRYTRMGLARTLLGLERFAECELVGLDVHERTSRTKGADHAETQNTRRLLGDLYARWGKPDEAAKYR
ncbi:MAG: serine/threonine protein kinase [Planctomycetes bacterium]|nr:serine/threonine protein kinase [Planctomycetota bacterium]